MRLGIEQQRQLSHLLKAELAAGRQLLGVLQEEHAALCGRDSEQITQISETKLSQLKAFEEKFVQRQRFLKECGLDPDKVALEQLLQTLDGGNPIVTQWGELQLLAEQLQRQNEINGGIVALSQRQVAMALDVLTGQTGATPTYGRSGKTASGKPSTRFAKA